MERNTAIRGAMGMDVPHVSAHPPAWSCTPRGAHTADLAATHAALPTSPASTRRSNCGERRTGGMRAGCRWAPD